MLFNTQPTILLQIFTEFMINSKVIFQNIIGLDNAWELVSFGQLSSQSYMISPAHSKC